MKLHIYSLALAAALSVGATAQELRSSYFMQTSNYRHEMNPALLDSSYVGMPLLMGYANVGATGRTGAADYIYKMQPSWQGYGVEGRTLTTFMHPSVDRDEFLSHLSKRNKIGAYLKYQLFGMSFKGFGGQNIVEVNLRSNTDASLPKDLFEFMKDAGSQSNYSISKTALTSQSYAEVVLGHAHQINEKLRVGAKMKVLFGMAYANFKAENFNLQLNDIEWNVSGNASLTASVLGSEFKFHNDRNYVDPTTGITTDRRQVKGFTGGKKLNINGAGLAFDFGATYQLLPELKLSAAVTDLGFISWHNVPAASSATDWTFDGFKRDIFFDGMDTGGNSLNDQLNDLAEDLADLFAVYDDGKKTERHALAATLNLGAEYTLPAYDKLRFGVLYTSRIAGCYSHHQAQFTATVRPINAIEVSANVAAGTSGVTCGGVVDFHARHFNLFLGTDRFFGKVSKQLVPLNRFNSDVAMGISFPL